MRGIFYWPYLNNQECNKYIIAKKERIHLRGARTCK